ncbi:related to general amidase [Zygosaccharomyces bailii]|nr:related to general amidase [Zygosaccharomyces bailii]
MTRETYIEIAERKKAARCTKFVKEWIVPQEKLPGEEIRDVLDWPINSGFLSSNEIEITECDLPAISKNIKARKWTAFQVASAYCHRASIAHQLVNCLSEVFFQEGLARAKELDDIYEKTGDLVGPLHGLPISLKDNLNVKGQATTIGFVGFALKPEAVAEDSCLVSLLRELGAVFLFKTNVPVAMMMPESMNHIFGNTCNPFNRALTSGGSSGGECALGALLGRSYCGIGSDIGGSLRIPASMQNLFTLRPSSGRFPTFGSRSGLPGLESVASVNGPISTSLSNIELYCETVVNQGKPWLHDPKCLEIPWRDVALPEKLVFAVLKDDGIVKPYPAISRAINTTVACLKKAGHEVIEWKPLHHKRLTEIIGEFFLSDGGSHCKKYAALSGEPFFSYMQMYDTAKDMHVSALWDLQAERSKLCKEYLDVWNSTASKTNCKRAIDAIIMPVSPYSGVGIGKFTYIGYTAVFNALDWAAGTVPVTRADSSCDLKDPFYQPRNEQDKLTYDCFNAEEVEGGPASVQVVCKKLQEEKLVALMKVIATALGTDNYWDRSAL